MMPWAAAVSKSPSNTQQLLLQQQQQLHHNHQQQLLQHQHQQQQQNQHLQHQLQQNCSSNNLINNQNATNQNNGNNSSFEPYNGSIGSWSLPESNNSSSRGGWNANDGTLKGDGVADDGTAIWGSTKKTGIDWTEKELLLNPPKPNASNSEKRIQKTETSVSSINGTEAWGAPAQKQQQAISTSKSTSLTTIPPTSLNNNPRNCNDSQSSELNQSIVGNGMSNVRGIGAVNGTIIGCMSANSSNNNINNLKLGANNSNDLLDSPNRQTSGSVTSNNRQSQFDSAAYANNNSNSSTDATPSRDLLKQMVHQIQLAVHAGHLNAQILNHPLSTPTLHLVYQLLQQIKNLHQLQQVKASSNSSSTIDMQINRTTHNISLLHKAITQQQQQQASMSKNEQIGDSNTNKQKQQVQNSANNYSYATISKISTNQKVPSSTNNIISNIDSFNKSNLIDTLKTDSTVQAKFDTNTFDKNFSPSMQVSSSADNVLVNSNKAITVSSDFSSKGQNFISANQTQQLATKGSLLSAQSSASSSSSTSSAAWSIFNSSGDYNSQKSWQSQLRISSNQVSQQDHQQQNQHQFGAFDMASDFGAGKAWCNLSDDKDNSSSLAPGGNIGSNIVRPNSTVSSNANQQKQLNGNNNLLNNEESTLFYGWNNDGDLEKRNNFGQISSSSSGTTSSIGNSGLSLQSNPWLFSQNNLGNGNLIDNLVKNNGRNVSSNDNKLGSVNGSIENNKPILGADAFKSSNNISNAHHRPTTSALFDWSNMVASASAIQYNNSGDDASKQTINSGSGSGLIGTSVGRPGPPPGLLSGLGNNNNINSLFDVDSIQSRDASASLWSGAWLD